MTVDITLLSLASWRQRRRSTKLRTQIVMARLVRATQLKLRDVPKIYFVYILASNRNGTLYIGVTDDIARRVWEHGEGLVPGFTQNYGVKRLVYFETFDNINAAIQRETRLKKNKREWKINLIQSRNVMWDDLYETLNG